ncbi:MAG: tRNA (uridine(34)/cytosine(34)/5-carboxymethylaminomethyluridine(34)-2'-O)-methyltransferase TrmL [Clostridia bacterium]|nr:tRNA (uridine(34)/cytosine(34)/5-carboxymethylaminomethyluridine(34)-2'-O)-methyltransferase TrmL [Clostridia bacterium]
MEIGRQVYVSYRLVEPEIPQNAGNIARTCAATGTHLHMIRPLGFEVTDKYLKRAGLDYWNLVSISYYDSFDELLQKYEGHRFFFFTTKGRHRYSDVAFKDGDFLVFGKETKGLPEELLMEHEETCLRIPMFSEARSLNLSNSVAVALYEALRQTDYEGLLEEGELHHHKWDDIHK